MSLARDDIGISGALSSLKSEFIKSRTLETKEISKEISGQELEPEIKDVFEKKSNIEENKVEKLQGSLTSLEISKIALNEIDASLGRIASSELDYDNSEELIKDIDELDKIIEEIYPENYEAEISEEEVEDEESDSEEASVFLQNVEESTLDKEANNKISELRAKLADKQQQIAHFQEQLYDEVSSLVELNIDDDENIDIERYAEELKKSVVNDIKNNPEISQKIQITNLNKDMILAMMSIKQ